MPGSQAYRGTRMRSLPVGSRWTGGQVPCCLVHPGRKRRWRSWLAVSLGGLLGVECCTARRASVDTVEAAGRSLDDRAPFKDAAADIAYGRYLEYSRSTRPRRLDPAPPPRSRLRRIVGGGGLAVYSGSELGSGEGTGSSGAGSPRGEREGGVGVARAHVQGTGETDRPGTDFDGVGSILEGLGGGGGGGGGRYHSDAIVDGQSGSGTTGDDGRGQGIDMVRGFGEDVWASSACEGVGCATGRTADGAEAAVATASADGAPAAGQRNGTDPVLGSSPSAALQIVPPVVQQVQPQREKSHLMGLDLLPPTSSGAGRKRRMLRGWDPVAEPEALRALATESSSSGGSQQEYAFPGEVILVCKDTVEAEGQAQGGQTVTSPDREEIVVMGSDVNVSWSLDSFSSDEGVELVNVTLFLDKEFKKSYSDEKNSGVFSWSVPQDLPQSENYTIAVWEESTQTCAISKAFGISEPQSVTVTRFQGFSSDVTPIEREPRTTNASDGSRPIYSCDGSVEFAWNTSGLIDYVEIRICQVPGSLGEGSIKGLVDEDLLEDGGGEQDGSTCLEPSADGIEADSSYVNVSFLEEVDTCGVYGEGFYANISREELRGDDVTGISRPVAVLGGVFLRPNETSRLLGELQLSISSPQEFEWKGLASSEETARVDIILRKNDDPDWFLALAEDEARGRTDGKFTWLRPDGDLEEAGIAIDENVSETGFWLEVFDAIGGGLICRSVEFRLSTDEGGSSDPSRLLLSLTPAGVLLLCCCGIFCVACPYYEKIVRRRRQERRPTMIDVDDTYVIDGEGQPAILALSAEVIPLAHAHYWSVDDASLGLNGHGTLRIRAIPPAPHAGADVTSRNVAGSVGGNPGVGSTSGSGDGSAVGGGRQYAGHGAHGGGAVVSDVLSSTGTSSSLSSWSMMRSGATWAFSGGGSIGRRNGGRRDGGGVYPTAAAALGIGQDLEEKSETVAASSMGGGGNHPGTAAASRNAVVTASGTGNNGEGGHGGAQTVLGSTRGRVASGANEGPIVHESTMRTYNPCAAGDEPVGQSAWFLRQSSRVDGVIVGQDRGSSNSGAIGGGRSGTGGSVGSVGVGGVMARVGIGVGDRAMMVEILVTQVEASEVEIVEVARAIVVNDAGVDSSTTHVEASVEVTGGGSMQSGGAASGPTVA